MRTTPQEEPVGRPTQAPAGTQEISKQTTSPAADIRSLPPSEGIPGPAVEQDMGVRSNAHVSEQQRQLGSAPMSETSPERAQAPPVAIDNRNPQDQELPQVARGALSEQNELADADRASVSAPSSSNRSVAPQNDNSTVAASVADDNTKIEPAAQAPSSAPIQQDRPAAAESSARGSGEQQQSTENLNTNKLSVAKHISIHYRRELCTCARGCAAPCQLADILRLRDAPPADDGTRRRVTRRPLFLQGRRRGCRPFGQCTAGQR